MPLARSASASSKRKSSFPAAASASICSPQAQFFTWSNQVASSQNSFLGRLLADGQQCVVAKGFEFGLKDIDHGHRVTEGIKDLQVMAVFRTAFTLVVFDRCRQAVGQRGLWRMRR